PDEIALHLQAALHPAAGLEKRYRRAVGRLALSLPNPNETVLLDARVRANAIEWFDLAFTLGRHRDALAGAVVLPSMKPTTEPPVPDLSTRERVAAVTTPIGKRSRLPLLVAEKDDLVLSHSRGKRARLKLGRSCCNIPMIR